MDCHNCAVRNVLQRVFDGMETRESALDQSLRAVEALPGAVLPPPAYVGLRKHGDNVHIRHGFKESFQSETQNGLTLKHKELLGDVRAHTHAAAAGGNH